MKTFLNLLKYAAICAAIWALCIVLRDVARPPKFDPITANSGGQVIGWKSTPDTLDIDTLESIYDTSDFVNQVTVSNVIRSDACYNSCLLDTFPVKDTLGWLEGGRVR